MFLECRSGEGMRDGRVEDRMGEIREAIGIRGRGEEIQLNTIVKATPNPITSFLDAIAGRRV